MRTANLHALLQKANISIVQELIQLVGTLTNRDPKAVPSDPQHSKPPAQTSSLRNSIIRIQESIEGAIDRLHRLGMTIRQASTGSLAARVKAFSTKKLSSSLEEVTALITTTLYQDAPVPLQRLLSRSILERYLRLKYMEHHHNNLNRRRPTIRPVIDEMDLDEPDSKDQEKLKERPTMTPVTTRDEINQVGRQQQARSSRPSTLPPQAIPRIMQLRQQPSRASSIHMADTRYPRPPKPQGMSPIVTCGWCRRTFEVKKVNKENWWRRVSSKLSQTTQSNSFQ